MEEQEQRALNPVKVVTIYSASWTRGDCQIWTPLTEKVAGFLGGRALWHGDMSVPRGFPSRFPERLTYAEGRKIPR